MTRLIFVGIASLLFGALIGSSVAQHNARKHQHARAVMWLSQFHLDRLLAASDAKSSDGKQCTVAASARSSLQHLAAELPLALPLAYEQEAAFRQHAEKFAQATGVPGAAANCSADVASAATIQDACDACHRDYRQ